MNFIIRIGISPEFAQKISDSRQNVVQMLVEKFPSSSIVSQGLYWAVLSLKGNCASDCYSVINQRFNELFPNKNNCLNLISIEDNDSPYSQFMQEIYGNFCGLDSFVEVCNQISNVLMIEKNNFTQNSRNEILCRLGFLISVDSGYGYSTMLYSLADMYQRYNLLADQEEIKVLEYKIGEEDSSYQNTICFDSVIAKLYKEENQNSIVGIDLSYFLNSNNYAQLRTFLNILKYFENNKYVFVYRIPVLNQNMYNKFVEVVNDIMQVLPINVPILNELQLKEFAIDYFSQCGIEVEDQKVLDLFLEKVRYEKRDGRFYGLNTVKKIVSEIVYAKSIKHFNNLENGVKSDISSINYDDVSQIVGIKQDFELTGYQKLEKLVGMDNIINQIKEVVSQIKLSNQSSSLDRPCIHMRFVGAPGTGKTTVARILGQILKEEGLLSKGTFFEYEARNLCGEYIGQTANKTRQICQDAYGSVLFLDEAYSLYRGDDLIADYGKEAVSTLITEMENNREDMVVIMAGYVDEMDTLMKVNPGLKSRMPYRIIFDNYDAKQLTTIFINLCSQSFEVSQDLKEEASRYFSSLKSEVLNSKEFSNARFVRNIFERTWSKCAYRLSNQKDAQLVITKADFVNAIAEIEQ